MRINAVHSGENARSRRQPARPAGLSLATRITAQQITANPLAAQSAASPSRCVPVFIHDNLTEQSNHIKRLASGQGRRSRGGLFPGR